MKTLDTSESAAFHDELAADYDRVMERDAGNAWVRAAFRQLVVELAPPLPTILDFGCGTGTDSLWYAAQGMRVVAYDNSSGMREETRSKCRYEITDGTIEVMDGAYEEFLERLPRLSGGDVIAANFAVLNMIGNLQPLFGALAGWVSPGGAVVASVLNPLYWREMKRPAHWRPAWDYLLRSGAVRPGPPASYRRGIRRYVEAAFPHFVLERRLGAGILVPIERGDFDWHRPLRLAQKLERNASRSPLFCRFGKFWFLVFRRRG